MKPTIRKRGSSSWQVSFTHDGRRYRHSFRLPTVAQRWADACQAAVLDGRSIPDPSAPHAHAVTFGDLMQRTFTHQWYNGPSEDVVKSALACLGRAFGLKTPASAITSATVVNVVTKWRTQAKPLGPATIQRYLSALRVVLTYGAKLGCISKLPEIESLTLPTKDRRIYLRHDEVKLIADMFNHHGHLQAGLWLSLAVETGMRPSEIEKLRWRHITDDGRKVNVPVVKTAHRRRLPLSDLAKGAIRMLKHTFPWTAGDDSNRYIFTSDDGRYRAKDFALDWNSVRKALGKDDEPDWVPYILRHTFISRLVLGGASMPAVMQAAGHTNLKTTMKYVHLQPLGEVELTAALQREY